MGVVFGTKAVGAIVDEGICHKVGGEDFDSREEGAGLGEGDVDGLNVLQVLGFVTSEVIPCAGGEEEDGEKEKELGHWNGELVGKLVDPILGFRPEGARFRSGDDFLVVEEGGAILAFFPVVFGNVE